MRLRLRAVYGLVALLAMTVMSGCAASNAAPSGGGAAVNSDPGCVLRAMTEDAGNVYLGVNLDWGNETVADYASALGHEPAAVVSFAPVPWTAQQRGWAVSASEQAARAGAILLLTLEPNAGLSALNGAVVADIVTLLQDITASGVPVILRLAHEMNGSWYAWGQQPEPYVLAFRRVADAVHSQVPGADMMWAPNYGGGYPFDGGAFAAPQGSRDRQVLDTNGDGVVTGTDDPYAPYYPGDAYVDWVGMSLYHWGSAYPWGENELPEPGKFEAQLTGTYAGLGGDDTALPDFYTEYGEAHGKPVAIPETAALVVPRGDDANERAIRQAWWRQVFAPDIPQRFPQLRLVNWFEWNKYEPEVSDTVGWAVLRDETTRAAFVADLPEWLRFGPMSFPDAC